MELNPDTTHPVIHIMSDQIGIEDIGGTLRLGSYPCVLKDNSLAYKLYGKKETKERNVVCTGVFDRCDFSLNPSVSFSMSAEQKMLF